MYRIFVAVFVLMMIHRSVRRLREGHMSVPRFLGWMLLLLGVGVVSWYPMLSQRITEYLGIGRGVDLFFFLSILLMVFLVFNLAVRQEQSRQQITDLVRALALRDLDREK
ncbi:MAG: DUF2304 domain-containing protein [Phycisphaeraceae bacterium]|nr:DUF2304 domain-containing protein [Phycisphaeraceae bacterium]